MDVVIADDRVVGGKEEDTNVVGIDVIRIDYRIGGLVEVDAIGIVGRNGVPGDGDVGG